METDHFSVHFPAEAGPWIRPLLPRMEAMHEAVALRVGHAPDRRVTVLVADPVNRANGFAVPVLNAPLMTLWPTPPGPRAGIGEHRGWGELLFLHEYAHLAHLTFRSRNRLERLTERLLPVRIGPVARRSPRWVVEGYATYLEGRLTGRGRPHGTTRPAFLRQRALEGRLPTYGQLSGAGGYSDRASAYLVGSAFLEWLVAREGEESLNHLWRRMSARERRPFSEAFAGVFGGPPEELYGRYTVELTSKALEAREILEEKGLEEGELWQMRRWATGEPALSPDGMLMAVTLHRRDRPGRLVVWETEEDEEAEERRREARQRLLDRDPLDVPAVEWRPPPPRTVATLHPVAGRAHHHPRFLPDGSGILTVRWEPLPDGTLRPDLFVWKYETGALRRVTRGEGIRHPDPSPDGEEAVAVRCRWGSCDVVRVELSGGEVTTLARGGPDRVYYRPRWSPEGGSVMASVQEEGRWRIVAIPVQDGAGMDGPSSAASTGGIRYLDPDDGANRYDAAFLPDGRGIVLVSDRGGIPDLEVLDLDEGGVRALTRVLGEVAAPEPHPGDGHVHFLAMHSRGWDLRQIHPDSSNVAPDPEPAPAVEPEPTLPEDLWPVARALPAEPADTFALRPVPEPRPYGLGPQRQSVLPAGGVGPGGGALHFALSSVDPVGRLGFLLQGALAESRSWSGASLSTAVRWLPVDLRAEGFVGRQRPSGRDERVDPLDVRTWGGLLSLEGRRWGSGTDARFRIGGVASRLRGPEPEGASRTLAFGEADARFRQSWGGLPARQRLSLELATGRTAGEGWNRFRVGGGLSVGSRDRALRLDASYGRAGGDALFEGFRVGGRSPLLFDSAVLSQQVSMPVFPPALLRGDRVATARASLELEGLSPFFWAGSVDRGLDIWHRVVGLEGRFRLPPSPPLSLPGATARLGVGHSLDDPVRDRTRFYLSVGLRP